MCNISVLFYNMLNQIKSRLILNTSKLSYELLNCKITWFNLTKYVESKHTNKQKQHAQTCLSCAEKNSSVTAREGETHGDTSVLTLNALSLPDIMRIWSTHCRIRNISGHQYPLWSFPKYGLSGMIRFLYVCVWGMGGWGGVCVGVCVWVCVGCVWVCVGCVWVGVGCGVGVFVCHCIHWSSE